MLLNHTEAASILRTVQVESFRMQTKVSTVVSYIHKLTYVTHLIYQWNSDGSHNLFHVFLPALSGSGSCLGLPLIVVFLDKDKFF